jgi:uncharacterized protein YjbI with pentapeptide repeats
MLVTAHNSELSMPDDDVSPSGGNLIDQPVDAVSINLDELQGKINDSVDLVRYRLTGQARLVHDLSSHNFISCVFDNVFVNEIDLTRCDFKDVLIKNSQFRRCKIQAATHTASVYLNSEFEECDFTNAAQTNCQLREVRFIKCNLSNLLSKDSRFAECTFSECRMETHVFENNIFKRSRFIRTDIETRTIFSNFGMKLSLTDNCRIRDGRANRPHTFISPEKLGTVIAQHQHDPLTILSGLYFLNGNLLLGGEEIDRAFEMESWVRLARQPTSFAQLIELLGEFLVGAFDDSEVDIHKILILHDITRQIIAADQLGSDGFQIRLAFGGIHLALSRLVEDYLNALADVSARLPTDVHVLVNGPPSKQYYEMEFADLLDHCGVRIGEARPHNSPTELTFIEQLPGGRFLLLALILATFVRFELHAAPISLPKPVSAPPRKKIAPPEGALKSSADFFALTAGLSKDELHAYELRIKSLVPATSIVIDLRLAVSTKFIYKIRTLVIRILEDK